MSAPLSHIVLGTSDWALAEAFHAPLLTMLGWRRRPSDITPGKLVWQPATAARPLFVVMPPFDGAAHRVGNGAMVALNAPDRATVDAAHAHALKLGGTCEGAPGLRPHYHRHYYGAYFRDRDANKLCVVCHTAPRGSMEERPVRLTRAEMIAAAQAWIAAWNRRDVEAVLAGFDSAATFRSPLAERTTGSAVIVGTEALRAYWEKALAGIDTLRFTLLDVLCDEERQALAIHYEAELNGELRRACELYHLQQGRKVSGEALYGCWA